VPCPVPGGAFALLPLAPRLWSPVARAKAHIDGGSRKSQGGSAFWSLKGSFRDGVGWAQNPKLLLRGDFLKKKKPGHKGQTGLPVCL
jgi:hypothetical protein